jgi:hypothetical protein
VPITVSTKGSEIPASGSICVSAALIVECKAARRSASSSRQAAVVSEDDGLRLAFIFNFNVDVLMPSGFERVAL